MLLEYALLASGSKGNCCIIRDDQTVVMIDCGTTKKYLYEQMRQIGIRPDEIDAVLITHDHADHISQIRHFADRNIYSPVEIADIEAFRVEPLRIFTVGSLRVTPLALSHDAPCTTGYVLDNGQEKLVYVTDTGYLRDKYFPLLYGARTIILESNHDVPMLMRTRRPQYIKARICSDDGHLCNEDCAAILTKITGRATKHIILAHISQEGNTRQRALDVTAGKLLASGIQLDPELIVSAAGQFERIQRGFGDEKVDPGSVCRPVGMESHTYGQTLFGQ